MIDNFAWYAIAIRTVTLAIAVPVVRRIFMLTRKVTRDQWIKYILALLITIVVINAAFALGVNFYRQDDGNLIKGTRHFLLVFTSTSGLASIVGWYILLRRDE